MRIASILIAALLLAACASTGNDFHGERLSQLQPGMTEQAVTGILGASPVSRTYQADGSYTAVWRYVSATGTTVTNNKGAALAFDSAHRFVRVVKTINLDPAAGAL